MLSETLLCFILFVTNGDTVVANCDHHQIIVRLAAIDAPEKRQDFGIQSKQSLVELCLYKNAEITPRTKDRFGRMVAYVNCAGVDANSEQIRRGMAWVFDKYVTDISLYSLQNSAQSKHKGLWKHSSPTPPWEWRKAIN
ncbi:nuclease (SNase domain-containing protein) [Nitrosomonas sp. Is79A3]|uniref:thermonuclease family protein n=1 Tax=Nitrosomonas sp. (strain Is79A3) TaxID=261292 RepID=UPI000215CAD8